MPKSYNTEISLLGVYLRKTLVSFTTCSRAHVCDKSLQSYLTLCDSMNCSPPGSSAHGFSRQEYWNGLPCPLPGDLLNPGIKSKSHRSPAQVGRFFTTSVTYWTKEQRRATPICLNLEILKPDIWLKYFNLYFYVYLEFPSIWGGWSFLFG